MSRSKVFGPIFESSLTRFGELDRSVRASTALKDSMRLENQRHMLKDGDRQRLYTLCKECGITTVIINFDRVPSALIGLWGRCKNNRDYTHHKFVTVSQSDYVKLRELAPKDRLNWYFFSR